MDEPKKETTKAAAQPVAPQTNSYISNPFTLTIVGVKRLFKKNTGPFVGLMVAVLVIIISLLFSFGVSFLGSSINS